MDNGCCTVGSRPVMGVLADPGYPVSTLLSLSSLLSTSGCSTGLTVHCVSGTWMCLVYRPLWRRAVYLCCSKLSDVRTAGVEAFTRITTPSSAVPPTPPPLSLLFLPWCPNSTLLSAQRTIHSSSLPSSGNWASNLGSRPCCSSMAASTDAEEPNIELSGSCPVGKALWQGLLSGEKNPPFFLWPTDTLFCCRRPNKPLCLPVLCSGPELTDWLALDMGVSFHTEEVRSSGVTPCFTGL